MKNIFIAAIILMLHGCVLVDDNWGYDIKYPDVVLEGDSIPCRVFGTKDEINHIYEHDDDLKSYPRLVGIVDLCYGGKKAMDVDHLPTGYKITFIALGTNDADDNVPLREFTEHYSSLYNNSDSDVIYCILPARIIHKKDITPYRDAIRSICSNVIDPEEYGLYGDYDGVHYTRKQHLIARKMLTDKLDLYFTIK